MRERPEQKSHGQRKAGAMFAAAMAVLLTLLAVAASVAVYPQAGGSVVYESGGATVDASNIDQGYVMVKMSSSKKLKVRITGANQYTYDLDGDGQYDVYPLQDGNREYSLVIYQQVKGNSYSQVLSRTLRPEMSDENAPFLCPNRYTWYTPDSAVVQLGKQLCEGLSSDQEKVNAVYQYVTSNIIYDYMAAMMVIAGQQTGYVPDLDEVLETKMGICFDYSALMGALLRSQGIPTQLVMGYADAMYHAWNNVLIDGEWVRYDATSAASFTKISQYTEEAVY